jgi:catechol 2,3-dioxygenase-like lactoylglutathione lyase family enzyme
VLNLDKSIEFYEKALNLKVMSRKTAQDGSFELVFLGDTSTEHQLELTWLRDRCNPYDLGDNEIHLALKLMTWKVRTICTEKWAVFATKIKRWEFTLSAIQTVIGSK